MPDNPKPALWNSLEVAKLIVSIATPVAVVIAGFVLNENLARQNDIRRSQEILLMRRLSVYDKLAPNLDAIYCYVVDEGRWQDQTPLSIFECKRVADDVLRRNQALWAPETIAAYQAYMDSAFQAPGAGEKLLRLRAETEHKSYLQNWQAAWADLFTAPDPDHQKKYDALMSMFSRDLDLRNAR
jgi:hypothetical protein